MSKKKGYVMENEAEAIYKLMMLKHEKQKKKEAEMETLNLTPTLPSPDKKGFKEASINIGFKTPNKRTTEPLKP